MLIEDFEIKNKLIGQIENTQQGHYYKLQQIISQNNNLMQFNLSMLKNVYDGSDKNIFNFFYQLLKKWNQNSTMYFDDTNWRMMQKLYQFIYLYIKKIEFSSKYIRSKNLICLYEWYNNKYSSIQNNKFHFMKKNNIPFKIDQNHIRDTFKQDREFQIKKYKRRQFVQKNFKSIIRKESKLSLIENTSPAQENIKRKLLEQFNKDKQLRQIQNLINYNITQKNKLKQKHYRNNSSNIFSRNHTQIIEKKVNNQDAYLRQSYAEIKQLKLIKINSKQHQIKKLNFTMTSLLKPKTTCHIEPIQGITLIENPLYQNLISKSPNKKLLIQKN